ncbi:hypothetical protein PH214_10090 [Nitratidesulfovibrio vulgaris]|nr:hypothetical protein [Nitratidesulfovibrio vulgaris]WCB45424.1 hypothetical protein PH214_10090 [Nitratidesulfovibrio vulgaris]
MRKDTGIPTLFIVGPGEFAPDNGEDGAGRLAGLTRKGYDLLKVDDGYLSPKAAQWFMTHAGGTPAGFRSVDGPPQTRIHTVNAMRVAVVFFPPLPQGVDDPTPEMVRDALSAGRKARSGADLVIGVSAWGSLNERDMLPRCEGVFDILFGSGTGSAFDGTVDGVAPGVLWARPERDGKGVNVVEVLALPQPGQPNDWVPGITIATRYIMLSDTVAHDPAMEAVIGSVPPVTAE